MFDFKSVKFWREEKYTIYRPTGYIIYMPTYRCNYKCYHCNIRYPKNNQNELTAHEINNVFRDSKILKGLPIDISGGEPFLKIDIIDIIKDLTNLGHTIGITTNGSFPKKISRLIREVENVSLINFAISIDCVKEIHDEIREEGAFEKAIDSLKILIENDINVCINTTISDMNIDYVKQVKTYFEEFNVRHNFILQSMTIGNNQNFDIKDIVHLLNKSDIKFGLSKGRFKINNCHAGHNGCLIDPWGDIYTCLTRAAYYYSDKYVMGNLRKYNLNFDDLWLSSDADNARNNVKKCNGCYGPCEINRETNYGEIDLRFLKEEVKQLNPPTCITMGDNNSIFLEDDWYDLENWPPKVRWTGKKATVYLKNGDNHNRLLIRAFTSFHIKGQILIDDKTVNKFEIKENEWKIIETRLPIKKDILKVTIDIYKTWSPYKINKNDDIRELGVAIQKIWIDRNE